jgi:hypothetical protein
MKMQLALISALAAAGLPAQTPPKVDMAYQQSGWFTAGAAMPMMEVFEATDGQTLAGKPFSAKEERHTLQVLSDGTRIERNESDTYYRDDQGRTRTERTTPAGMSVTISDPVAGYSYFLDPTTKTARKFIFPKGAAFRVMGEAGGGVIASTMSVKKSLDVMMAAPAAGTGPVTISHRAGPMAAKLAQEMAAPSKEDLGTNVINGVSAEGSRTTFTIPVGQIGNDREIRTVTERWYSSDLQMLIKSSTTDPRFGDTSYELTNIVRAVPDPALFQVPADYAVREVGKPPLP